MAFCIKCGTQLPDEAKFCTNCGSPHNPAGPKAAPDPAAHTTPPERHGAPQNQPSPQPGPKTATSTIAPKRIPWKIIIPVAAAIVAAVTVLVVVVIPALSGGDRSLVGEWEIISGKDKGYVLTFARNGEGEVDGGGDLGTGSLKWSVENNVLTVSYSMCGTTETSEYYYTIEGDTMTWVDVNNSNRTSTLKKR